MVTPAFLQVRSPHAHTHSVTDPLLGGGAHTPDLARPAVKAVTAALLQHGMPHSGEESSKAVSDFAEGAVSALAALAALGDQHQSAMVCVLV